MVYTHMRMSKVVPKISITARRKFLDRLKEGREEQDISPVEEKYTDMKREIGWRIELVKKREIRPYSSLRI